MLSIFKTKIACCMPQRVKRNWQICQQDGTHILNGAGGSWCHPFCWSSSSALESLQADMYIVMPSLLATVWLKCDIHMSGSLSRQSLTDNCCPLTTIYHMEKQRQFLASISSPPEHAPIFMLFLFWDYKSQHKTSPTEHSGEYQLQRTRSFHPDVFQSRGRHDSQAAFLLPTDSAASPVTYGLWAPHVHTGN